MKTTLKQYKVSDIVKGFIYNEAEGKGLFGLGGKLTIQPEYQRNYIYGDYSMARVPMVAIAMVPMVAIMYLLICL